MYTVPFDTAIKFSYLEENTVNNQEMLRNLIRGSQSRNAEELSSGVLSVANGQ
jgi:hypothetical protein